MILLAFGIFIVFLVVVLCKLAYENGVLKETVRQNNEEIKYLKVRGDFVEEREVKK